MDEPLSFRFEGLYRIQSRLAHKSSTLVGQWIAGDPPLIDGDTVNSALKRSDLWLGQNLANVKGAFVTQRSGAFTEPDALYYRDAFIPDSRSEAFLFDVIDVSKLQDLWIRRREYLAELFGEQFGQLESLLGDVATAANNEYHVHEGGHLLGWDIKAKYRAGYFRLGGKVLWPLIHTEEHRADLHSLGLALEVLPLNRAIQVFVYHILHRFGLAMESTATGGADAGPIPYLLFRTLFGLGFLSVSSGGLRLTGLEADSLARAMKLCSDHACEELTFAEVTSRTPVDIALNAARYHRSMTSDAGAFEMFSNALNASISRCSTGIRLHPK